MNDILLYLLKVSAGLAIICLPYYLLFRNDPNLILKRIYLISGLIASWVFPFITFRKLTLAVDLSPTVFIDLETPVAQPGILQNAESASAISINWLQILLLVYLAGLIFMFLKNLYLIIKWNLAWQRNHNEEGVAFTRSDQVFTLFTRIFVPGSLKDQEDLNNVLLHEKAHIRQLHYIDLMLMECTLLLTWFNPFSWLISRMIKENHEHLADREVLSAGIDAARYRAQLMNHTLGVNVFRLGTQFNHSLTLKRFKMMKKPRKSPKGFIKIAFLIPAVLITLGLTVGMTPQQKTVKGKVVLAETGEPVPGASIVIRNGTTGCVTDMDGTFMLNVEGNPELVISFVGYESLIVKASEAGKSPLKLEVKTYSLDLEKVPLEESREISGSVWFKASDGSDADPVFVLDGKVVSEINDLDPGTIESVSVIKDPDDPMMKKYNAKDGVILITTKQEKLMLAPKESKNVGEETLGNESAEEVFYVVEDMPRFPGDLPALKRYIYSNLEYPDNAKNQGITGEVIVRFLINTKGEAVNSEILRSSHKDFEAPALKVINEMPVWTPGKQRGKPVNVWHVMSIKFDDEML